MHLSTKLSILLTFTRFNYKNLKSRQHAINDDQNRASRPPLYLRNLCRRTIWHRQNHTLLGKALLSPTSLKLSRKLVLLFPPTPLTPTFNTLLTPSFHQDCCKPSCAWTGKGQAAGVVGVCDINDNPLSDPNAKSGCEEGGTAFTCSSQGPWAVNESLAYGFAAVSASNAPSCCSCYELTFKDTVLAGKKMVVQATNTGYDVDAAQFDIAVCLFPLQGRQAFYFICCCGVEM